MPRRPATVRARGLGAELRELREKSNLTTREVARMLGWSASTVSRTETGHRNISSEDVSALLAVYGVAGRERDHLLALAREANQPGWWETRHPGLPAQLTALIGFESQATRITDVALIVFPGLLQTADYARAVMEAAGISAVHAETRVATRLGRQAALSRPNPPQYLAILDEAVLRRPIGGRNTMAAQLRHVLNVAERPNVEVRVLPFDRGAHAGLAGSFVVLAFPKAPTIVHLEHKRSSLLLDEPGDVTAFTEAADLIRNVAFDPIRSAEFIAKVAAEYES
ncbi:helix-turn-helix domain-containing protein [Actinoallomurus spadix]|uniref:Helix-turn-helix transcriptional regulator n=1 Tax=Actinoallomurus spadix TaxID=79912 RepID=A0ABP3FH22_9ACTN|nr:helix-turn-helix transcriptional regulator [Actinoallomurus spadix]MCO5989996.1 helix-turn-helix domain-containing protein [Actinoallomurus spadix]